jgi:hypothetical protein
MAVLEAVHGDDEKSCIMVYPLVVDMLTGRVHGDQRTVEHRGPVDPGTSPLRSSFLPYP